jgi:hypothetical protein
VGRWLHGTKTAAPARTAFLRGFRSFAVRFARGTWHALGRIMLKPWNRRATWTAGLIGWGVVCLSTGICCIPGTDHSEPKRDPLGATPSPALVP